MDNAWRALSDVLSASQKWTTEKKQKVSHWSQWFDGLASYQKIIALLSVFVCGRYVTLKLHRKIYNYPPGPIGLPFVGCLVSFGLWPRRFLYNLERHYGGIACVPLGVYDNIFLSRTDAIEFLMKKTNFNDRPLLYNSPRPQGQNDVVFINGQEWSRRRRYASKSLIRLADSSFIARHVNNAVKKDVCPAIEAAQIEQGKLWFPRTHTSFFAMNIVFSAIFGVELRMNDAFIQRYIAQTAVFLDSLTFVLHMSMLINFKLPDKLMWGVLSNHRKNAHEHDVILSQWMNASGFFEVDTSPEHYVLKRLKYDDTQHNKHGDEDEEVFLDFLIKEFEAGKISIEQIISDIQAVLAGSIDTTRNGTEYGFVLLAKYPAIQQRIYEEVKRLYGDSDDGDAVFDFEHIHQLHLLRAFVHEMMRISNVVPLGLPHRCQEDCEYKGYVIRKGSLVHINSYFVHKWNDWGAADGGISGRAVHDKECDEIHLEYWLDEQQKFQMNRNFFAFGAGRRDCAGRAVAVKAAYAIFGSLLLRYKFVADGDPDAIKITQEWGTVQVMSPPIGIKVQKRIS